MCTSNIFGQQGNPSPRTVTYPTITDSLLATDDSAIYFSLFASKRKLVNDKVNQLKNSPKQIISSLLEGKGNKKSYNAGIYGGYASYALNYRSVIDTPYAEKNILQHNISGQLNFFAAGIPLQATYLVRRSNSKVFQNIQDIQLSLDPMGWRSMMLSKLTVQMEKTAQGLEDSLTGKLLDLESLDLDISNQWLKGPFQIQRLIEANETLRVPGITHKAHNSKELNIAREDSLKSKAEKFLSLYKRVDSLHKLLSDNVDSLKGVYTNAQNKARLFRQLTSGNFGNYADYQLLRDRLSKEGLPDVELPRSYEHLMAIRTFSIGRSPLQYSELTAKNVSINGINVEYNSWYYAAFSAGVVDFRFRDFAIGRSKQKQYVVMGRAGIGSIDNSHFIISLFKGYKQLFSSGNGATGISGIDITGYSAEARWKIGPNSYLTTEVAQSISPDFSAQDLSVKTKFNLADYSNKALAVKLSAYYPKSKTRIEGSFKYTGSNYQSFSSFQTNSQLKTWYAKAEQAFFGRMFKLTGSIRTNDFTNPHIIQNYKSNMVFKTVNVAFRKKDWPALSLGYMPVSQFTMINNQLAESKFQSLNANMYHYYLVRSAPVATTIMFNKYYNTSSDTGFVYYNANNIYFAQNIFLGVVTANLSISDTRNSQYQVQVFDESLQYNGSKNNSYLFGIKINHFNQQEVKVGAYVNSTIKVWKNDRLFFAYERGFLPGYNNRLIKNDIATIQFTKVFGSISTHSTNIL